MEKPIRPKKPTEPKRPAQEIDRKYTFTISIYRETRLSNVRNDFDAYIKRCQDEFIRHLNVKYPLFEDAIIDICYDDISLTYEISYTEKLNDDTYNLILDKWRKNTYKYLCKLNDYNKEIKEYEQRMIAYDLFVQNQRNAEDLALYERLKKQFDK